LASRAHWSISVMGSKMSACVAPDFRAPFNKVQT